MRPPDAMTGGNPREAPTLDAVLAILGGRREELARRGVERLWVFGSVARGDAGPDSDVDLIAEIPPEAGVSLTAFARLRMDLEDMLGRRVDLGEWRTLRPHVAGAARRDAVRVF